MTDFWDTYYRSQRGTQDFLNDFYDRQAGRRMANALALGSQKHLEDAQQFALRAGRFDTGEWIRTRGGRQALGWAQPTPAGFTPPNALATPTPGASPAPGVAAQGVPPPAPPAPAAPAAPGAAPQTGVAPAADGGKAAISGAKSGPSALQEFRELANYLLPEEEETARRLLTIQSAPNATPEQRAEALAQLNELVQRLRARRDLPGASGQMLQDTGQAATAEGAARLPGAEPGAPITPAPGATTAAAPGAQAAAAQPQVTAQTVDLDRLITQATPPVLSQHMQQLANMRQNAIRFGLLEDVEQLSALMDNERSTAAELFAARLQQGLSIIPVLRGIDPNQRLAVARMFIQNSPYGYDTDGSPLMNQDALKMMEMYAEGGVSDQELDALEQTTLTLANRLDEQYRNRALEAEQGGAWSVPQQNQVAGQYARGQSALVDDMGNMAPNLGYAMMISQDPSRGDRYNDTALLRAAARAQTGPGVLTDQEVVRTIGDTLAQRLRQGNAFLDEEEVSLSADARKALANYVIRTMRPLMRTGWDAYETIRDGLPQGATMDQYRMAPPRFPHPEDMYTLAVRAARDAVPGNEYAANGGRVYTYQGNGAWEFSRFGGTSGGRTRSYPTVDPGGQMTARQPTASPELQTRAGVAALQARRITPHALWAEAEQRGDTANALRILLAWQAEGGISASRFRDVTGMTPQQARAQVGG